MGGFRGHLRLFSNFEYKLHKVLSVQNWNMKSSSILFFYVMQGRSGWGKFTWFYMLTSEIDNLCNIKRILNSFLLFRKAYVCKLADIEKKVFYSQIMTAKSVKCDRSILGILIHWLCQKPQECILLNTNFHTTLPKSTLNNRH